MLAKKLFACAVLATSLLAQPANEPRILLLPSQGSTVSVFANEGLTALTPINAPSGATAILARPDGNRYFVVSGNEFSVADAAGNEIQAPAGFGLPIAAAEITPDGSKILFAAGTSLYSYDISGDTIKQLPGASLTGTPYALAVSLDSRDAFVLTAAGLSRINLTSNTVTGTVQLAGMDPSKSSVVAGPNGLLYVNAQGALHEVNPRTLESNPIPVPAFPSKPVFSPDGTKVWVAGLGATTGQPALMIIDLAARTVTHTLNSFGVAFDYMLWGGPDKIYAYSSSTRKLYQMTETLSGLDEADFPAIGKIQRVSAAFNSTEVPNGQEIVGPKYLFVVAPDTLYRIDLAPLESTPPEQTVTSVPLPGPSRGGIFFMPPATAASTIARTHLYGDKQNVVKGEESMPLVFRLVDHSGRPIMGMPVTFTASRGGVVDRMTATNSAGLAQAIWKAPDTEGTFSVTATFAGTSIYFELRSVSPGSEDTPGQDPGPGASGISILSGNGQVMCGGSRSPEPILLRVTDGGGSPVPGAKVTFAISGGTGGSVVANQGYSCEVASGGTVCITDSNGQVEVRFWAPMVNPTVSWIQTTINASVAGLSGVASPSVTIYQTAVPARDYDGSLGQLPLIALHQPAAQWATLEVQAGQTLAGAIEVSAHSRTGLHTRGDPVPNVGLQVRATPAYDRNSPSPAYCAGGTVLSNADGIATCNLQVPIDTQPGTYQIYAIVGGNTPLGFYLKVTAPPPSVPTTVAIVSGNNQSGTPGQELALVAEVRDQFGRLMPNVGVQWSVVSGSATLSSPATKTDANGQASTKVVLGGTAGEVVVRVTAGNATPAEFKLTVAGATGNLAMVTGDGQTVVIGQQFQPVAVRVTDSAGNALAGVAVNFAVTSGEATPMSQSAVTNAEGIAAATFTATNNPGSIVVTASVGSATVQFQLAARLPGPLLTADSFLNGASMQPGISTGSIAAIKGHGLTTGLSIPPGTCLTAAADGNIQRELPTQLAGIEVVFEWFHLAPILAICKTPDGYDQINVQVPFEVSPGANLRADVTTGIGTSWETTVSVTDLTITDALPGIFEYQASADARGAVALRPDGTVVSPSNPAHRGEEIRLYTTGLGPVLPTNGVPVKTNQPGYPGQMPFYVPTVQLGDVGAPGVTAEYAQNLIGVFIVTFQVPTEAPIGDAVPVVVTVAKANGETVSSLPSSIPIAE